MISKIKNGDNLLGVVALIMLLIGTANALEYFFARKSYLTIHNGVVEKVVHEEYFGRRNRLYSKTTIWLKGVNKNFHVATRIDEGGYIGVDKGESITIYARKWYQVLYSFNFSDNIYFVEKGDQIVYNNLNRWKTDSLSYMCLFGGCAVFLLIIYLDKVKNISLENWFQRKVLKNPDYFD